MRFPVKLYLPKLPGWLCARVPGLTKANPRFLALPACAKGDEVSGADFWELVTTLGSGNTWKSTAPQRHPRTDALIVEACGKHDTTDRPILLDIGVSDGITSVDLIHKLGGCFQAYYATDVSFWAQVIVTENAVFFYGEDGACVMAASRHFVAYSSLAGAIPPMGWLAHRQLSRAPLHERQRVRQVSLVNPRLRQLVETDPRVSVREYSIFECWPGPAVDVVKVANLLNRAYFSDAQLTKALRNIRGAMKDGGTLFITDNRPDERVTVMVRTRNGFALRDRVNGGSDVTDIALSRTA